MISNDEQGRPKGKRSKRFLLFVVAFHLLIVLGLWQGDFHETLMNGSTL